jgi:photosystem II stability/assembly factor-like uncharacterized protein
MKHFQLLLFIVLLTIPIWTSSAQWKQRTNLNGYNVNTFLESGNNIFAGTSNGVYLTSDGGSNWSAANTGLIKDITYLAIIGTNLFASDGYTGVFRSTDDGASWTSVNNGLSNPEVNALAVKGDLLFAGTRYSGTLNGGMYFTTDFGNSWSYVNNGMEKDSYTYSIVVYKDNIYTTSNYQRGGLLSGGVYLSTNDGASWSSINSGLMNIACVSLIAVPVDRISGPDLYVGDVNSPNGNLGAGAYLSTDCGSNWTVANKGIENVYVRSFTHFGEKVYALSNSTSHIYLTKDHGSLWNPVNTDSLPNAEILSQSVIGTELFVGIFQKGIWSRPLSEISDINNKQPKIPSNFDLYQNYPNPFNPETNISFTIPQSRFVTLKIYDLMGREKATLVNEYKPSGNYTIKFDGNKLSSGVYFYRIEAGEYIATKKFILMK